MRISPDLTHRTTLKGIAVGVVFGLMFPAVAIALVMFQLQGNFGASSIIQAHLHNYLLFIIDTAPFFLGIFAGIAGIHQARLELANNQLANQVYIDELTKINNRLFGQKKLEEILPVAKRKKKQVGVIFIDLDRLKSLNDNMGHWFGDQVLIAFAQRLIDNKTPQEFVARIAGEEFMVIVETIHDAAHLDAVVQRYIKLCQQDLCIAEKTCRLNISVGVAIYPDHGEDMETMFKHADVALYANKETRKSGYEVFNSGMLRRINENFLLEKELRQAISNNELSLFYQPIVDTQTQAIVAAEALLRWNSRILGSVSPAKFIPVAESTNLILEIGKWVLLQACRQNRAWQDAGLDPIIISVNVSANQLAYRNFTDTVYTALQQSGLSPHHLKLEITETASMENIREASAIFQTLKKQNIQLSIDDFGTGYSSLSKLKSLSVDDLKIDKSFIDDIKIDGDHQQPAIIEAIIAMARKLNIKVIAEGVETAEQLSILKDCQCDYIQGYLFSKALHHTDFAHLLSENQTTHIRQDHSRTQAPNHCA